LVIMSFVKYIYSKYIHNTVIVSLIYVLAILNQRLNQSSRYHIRIVVQI
jgi:hypothetical protein